jgi:uncharacterized protein involved in type VI secretion and phage assembly
MSTVTVDWLSDPPEEDDDQDPKRFYGVVTGRVINLVDEMQLGRVQVQLPFIDDIDLSPWARVATPMSGVACGMQFLPQVDDEVLVAFEHGDTNVPYILGSLWNGFHPPLPNFPVPDSPIRTSYSIRTLAGNQVLMVEAPPMIQILAPGAGQSVTMTEAGTALLSASSVSITVGDSTVLISPAGIQILGKTISLAATSTLNLTAPTVNMNGATGCNIIGGKVMINP